jgi:S1-C subfamily serine protease
MGSMALQCAVAQMPEELAAPEQTAPEAKSPSAPPAPAAADAVSASVVRIMSNVRLPDLTRPWTRMPARKSYGSGVVIEGKRILTTAHLVQYAAEIEVQGTSGNPVSARVEFVAPGIGFALLKLDDESFFESHPALARAGAMPEVKQAVMAYGYATGGTTLSITKGVVSRVDYESYNYPVSALRIQIDAAINPGNSGGPAVVDGKMIGIAYARAGGAQNIGYIAPGEEIELFLQDVTDGHYDGKPMLYGETTSLQNPALRGFLNLPATAHGVVVNTAEHAAADSPLKQWDLIEKIGDVPVDDEGKVVINRDTRVRFEYLIPRFTKDGKVPLTVNRRGQDVALQVPVEYNRPKLIPFLQGRNPSYFILGPVVFTAGTEDYLALLTAGAQRAGSAGAASGLNAMTLFTALTVSENPLVAHRGERPSADLQEFVVIPGRFLPHKLARGYRSPSLRVVKTVNGVPVKSLTHLVELLRDSQDEYISLELAGRGADPLMFPRKEMITATEEIMADNGIRAQGSPDMLAVWNAKR